MGQQPPGFGSIQGGNLRHGRIVDRHEDLGILQNTDLYAHKPVPQTKVMGASENASPPNALELRLAPLGAREANAFFAGRFP
jgi:hypothetical protein